MHLPRRRQLLIANLHLSKSPLLSSPKYNFTDPKDFEEEEDQNMEADEAINNARNRRLSLKMKLS